MDGSVLGRLRWTTGTLLSEMAHHPERTMQVFSAEPKQRDRLTLEDDILAREMEDILSDAQRFSSASPDSVAMLEAMILCWRDLGLKVDLCDLRPVVLIWARSHRHTAFLRDLYLRVEAGLDTRVRLDLSPAGAAALQATLKPAEGGPCLTWRSLQVLKPILHRAAEIWKEDASSLSGGSFCVGAAIVAYVIQKRCRIPRRTYLINAPSGEDTPNAAYHAAIAYLKANLPVGLADDAWFDCGMMD